MRIFILEDEIDSYPREQIKTVLKDHELVIAKSCGEAKVKYVGHFDLLLLDHDMRGYPEPNPKAYPNTGYQFCKWLVEKKFNGPKPEVILHSQNGVGRKNMALLLLDYGFTVREAPFSPAYVNYLKEKYGKKLDKG